ncbi:hypothetical protein [Numidum massiliense]|uniref:hypothetical protein n=1 Tax=Numidum massiliense TaxID=1522315 RepID=UPI0006D59F65|nr:hypothetical protein [Numidum massiliense]
METYVLYKDGRLSCDIFGLAYYIWDDGISLSYFKSDVDVNDSDEISLSWDKWIDNPEWDSSDKFKEHIYIERMSPSNITVPKLRNKATLLTIENIYLIEVAEDAVIMDIRAYKRLVYYLSKELDGIVYLPSEDRLLNCTDYYQVNKSIINLAFTRDVTN